MFLRDIAIYADEAIVETSPPGFVGWFHRETCCITDLYITLLQRKIVTPDTVKVSILFTEAEKRPRMRQLIDVADVVWPFTFRRYIKADEEEKKRLILDTLHDTLIWIATERGWNQRPLKAAYAQILELNLTFEGWSKRKWLSPDRKRVARIYFRQSLRDIELYVLVLDRRGRELGRKFLGSTIPESGIAWSLIGGGRWKQKTRFALSLGPAHFAAPKAWETDLAEFFPE